MTVNEKIKQIRLKKEMKQAHLAKQLGVTVQSYCMKETGKRPITTDELQIIAKTLKVPIATFFDK